MPAAPHRFCNRRFIGITAVAVVSLLLAALWQAWQPKVYRLQVINRSDLMVDQARVMGSALLASNSLTQLQPGDSGLLEAQLHNSGELRFEVTQQGIIVDLLVVKDGTPEHWQQTLHVENQRRFLLSEGLLESR